MLTIDRREVQEHPEIPSLLNPIPNCIDTLEEADYAFLDRNMNPVGIEKATITDLMGKMVSGRLEEQITRCSKSYNTTILMVEGVWDAEDGWIATYSKTPKRKGKVRKYECSHVSKMPYSNILALLVRLSDIGVEVLYTPNLLCSMEAIKIIYTSRRKSDEEHTLFKKIRQVQIPVKLSSNPAVPMLLSLCPRMPDKVAIRLIGKYGTIWNVLHADAKELKEIEGIGSGLIEKLFKGVGKT
jgi:ERCC4-type nuclease